MIDRDRAGAVPYAELAALDASGLLGITVPAAYGGPDLSPVVLAEVPRFPLDAEAAARHDLSRHWRNARTHASHDPVDWKYHHVGNYLLNHVLPPNHGQLLP